MADEEILNRRLLKGEAIVYPITRQENVIGLQRTITDKLPIVSSEAPAQGTYVERQSWFDTSENNSNQESEQITFLSLGRSRHAENELIFPSDANNEPLLVSDNEGGQWLFPENNGSNEDDELIFPSDGNEEETVDEPEESTQEEEER